MTVGERFWLLTLCVVLAAIVLDSRRANLRAELVRLNTFLEAGVLELESRIDALRPSGSDAPLNDDDWRRFYTLLGGYRGVSGTLLAYSDEARLIDWASWREERFS